MLKIELCDMRFHGYHGVHEHEKKTGGEFEVNLIIHFQPKKIPVLRLEETIDYSALYEIIKLRMNRPTQLIETLATEIAEEIFSTFDTIEEVNVSVKKLNPPIPFFNGNVAAVYNKKR